MSNTRQTDTDLPPLPQVSLADRHPIEFGRRGHFFVRQVKSDWFLHVTPDQILPMIGTTYFDDQETDPAYQMVDAFQAHDVLYIPTLKHWSLFNFVPIKKHKVDTKTADRLRLHEDSFHAAIDFHESRVQNGFGKWDGFIIQDGETGQAPVAWGFHSRFIERRNLFERGIVFRSLESYIRFASGLNPHLSEKFEQVKASLYPADLPVSYDEEVLYLTKASTQAVHAPPCPETQTNENDDDLDPMGEAFVSLSVSQWADHQLSNQISFLVSYMSCAQKIKIRDQICKKLPGVLAQVEETGDGDALFQDVFLHDVCLSSQASPCHLLSDRSEIRRALGEELCHQIKAQASKHQADQPDLKHRIMVKNRKRREYVSRRLLPNALKDQAQKDHVYALVCEHDIELYSPSGRFKFCADLAAVRAVLGEETCDDIKQKALYVHNSRQRTLDQVCIPTPPKP